MSGTMDKEEHDEPLSPIVGYDDRELTQSSGEGTSDSEPEGLAEANAQLEKMVSQQLKPEPNTPRSAHRKRIRNRKYRKEQKRLKLELEETEDEPAKEEKGVPGDFKTASEKTVDKAEIFLENVKEGEDEEQEKGMKTPPRSSPPFMGLMTASGKEVKISEKSLAFVRGVAPPEEKTEGQRYIGWKTAAGKKLFCPERLWQVGIKRVQLSPEKENVPSSSNDGGPADGMTQEVEDAIEALLADGDEF